ncbi:MAG: hypothetical protein KJN60_07510 [Boseongicola sp.]|nr:hypothetical protein [Boseongicola sp.]
MTPVTEDQVLSLMKGLEAREKRAMKRLVAASDDLSSYPGRATARVFAFEGAAAKQSVRRLVPADIIPLAQEQKAQAAQKTIHGRFVALVPKPSA